MNLSKRLHELSERLRTDGPCPNGKKVSKGEEVLFIIPDDLKKIWFLGEIIDRLGDAMNDYLFCCANDVGSLGSETRTLFWEKINEKIGIRGFSLGIREGWQLIRYKKPPKKPRHITDFIYAPPDC